MYHLQFNKKILLLALLSGIVACSSKPVVHDFPPTAAPADEIAQLEKDLGCAREKQVDILSPRNFKEAQSSLDDAKTKFFSGKDSQMTLHKVAIGKTMPMALQALLVSAWNMSLKQERRH